LQDPSYGLNLHVFFSVAVVFGKLENFVLLRVLIRIISVCFLGKKLAAIPPSRTLQALSIVMSTSFPLHIFPRWYKAFQNPLFFPAARRFISRCAAIIQNRSSSLDAQKSDVNSSGIFYSLGTLMSTFHS